MNDQVDSALKVAALHVNAELLQITLDKQTLSNPGCNRYCHEQDKSQRSAIVRIVSPEHCCR